MMVLGSVTSSGRIRDDLLDFDAGNNWDTVRPFFETPAWWRRFIFRVLTPREFTVYCYIISYCRKARIARPFIRHMKADLNIANSNVIHKAINKLVAHGFLLKNRYRFNNRLCNVYKRPSIEHTLMALIDKNLIDGNLVPITGNKNASQGDRYNRILGPVSDGLKALLGDDRHSEWVAASDLQKRTVLYKLLDERLTIRINEFEAKKLERGVVAAPESANVPAVSAEDRKHPAYDLFFFPDGTPRPAIARTATQVHAEDDFPDFDEEDDNTIPF